MKKPLLLLFYAFMFVAPSLMADACVYSQDIQPVPIVRKDKSEGGTTRPMAPASIPIEVYYVRAMSSLMFTFKHDVGVVTIEVMSTLNGEWYQNILAGHVGTELFQMPENKGHFFLNIILGNGVEYLGEFDIE